MFTNKNSSTLVAEEDLYLDKEGKTVVKAGDARAATLLARAGDQIPPKLVDRLKLSESSKVGDPQKDKVGDPQKPGEDSKTVAKTVAPEDIAGRSTRPLDKGSLR